MLALILLLVLPSLAAPAVDGGDLAASAAWHAQHTPKLQRNDCSGLVESVYRRAGVTFTGSTKTYWNEAKRRKATHSNPRPGDLAFFDNTFDKNGNGRVDDPLTHIAVVTEVLSDGTIVMVHRGGQGITEIRANLSRPNLHVKGDQVLNDYLRRNDGVEGAPRLAGQMVRGFATMYGPEASEGTGDAEPQTRTEPRPKDRPRVVAESEGRPGRPGTDLDGLRAFERAKKGKKVRRRQLRGLDCEELWIVRNTAYARHGYDFQTSRAQRFFRGEEWYDRDRSVNQQTIADELSKKDVKTMERAQKREFRGGCR